MPKLYTIVMTMLVVTLSFTLNISQAQKCCVECQTNVKTVSDKQVLLERIDIKEGTTLTNVSTNVYVSYRSGNSQKFWTNIAIATAGVAVSTQLNGNTNTTESKTASGGVSPLIPLGVSVATLPSIWKNRPRGVPQVGLIVQHRDPQGKLLETWEQPISSEAKNSAELLTVNIDKTLSAGTLAIYLQNGSKNEVYYWGQQTEQSVVEVVMPIIKFLPPSKGKSDIKIDSLSEKGLTISPTEGVLAVNGDGEIDGGELEGVTVPPSYNPPNQWNPYWWYYWNPYWNPYDATIVPTTNTPMDSTSTTEGVLAVDGDWEQEGGELGDVTVTAPAPPSWSPNPYPSLPYMLEPNTPGDGGGDPTAKQRCQTNASQDYTVEMNTCQQTFITDWNTSHLIIWGAAGTVAGGIAASAGTTCTFVLPIVGTVGCGLLGGAISFLAVLGGGYWITANNLAEKYDLCKRNAWIKYDQNLRRCN